MPADSHQNPKPVPGCSSVPEVGDRQSLGQRVIPYPVPTLFPLVCVYTVHFNAMFPRTLENNKCSKTCRAKTISISTFVVQLSQPQGIRTFCDNSSWNSEFVQIQESDKCCLIQHHWQPLDWTSSVLEFLLADIMKKYREQKWNSNKSEICYRK